jgi:hypothetical protein
MKLIDEALIEFQSFTSKAGLTEQQMKAVDAAFVTAATGAVIKLAARLQKVNSAILSQAPTVPARQPSAYSGDDRGYKKMPRS